MGSSFPSAVQLLAAFEMHQGALNFATDPVGPHAGFSAVIRLVTSKSHPSRNPLGAASGADGQSFCLDSQKIS